MKIATLAIIVLFLAVYADAQCPSLIVTGPSGVTNPGDEMKFRVEVGAVGPRLEYSWSVSAGTIIEGQGAPSITVATDGSMQGTNLTATVTVGGLQAACEKSGSEIAPIGSKIGCGGPSDEWGKIRPNDQRSRLDNVFAELANNPTNTGFLILSITQNERLDAGNHRIQFVLKHAKFRRFDPGRIWFALELAEEPRTKYYRVPPGAEVPCAECLIIKGGDLQ